MTTTKEEDHLSIAATIFESVQNVLIIAPHPGDEVFGCGATLSLLHDGGSRVATIIVTSGEIASVNPEKQQAEKFFDESCAAANLLGLDKPVFWKLPDHLVKYDEPIIGRLSETIQKVNPDFVFLPSPTGSKLHHQVIGFAGAEAIRRLGGKQQFAFYEVTDPLPCPNLIQDISIANERKTQAIRCFSSLLVNQPYDTCISGINGFRAFQLGNQVKSAEAFTFLTTTDLDKGLTTLLEGPQTNRPKLGFADVNVDVPLVSVIIRSMDRPSLSDALDSVAAQEYPSIEIVIINAKGEGHRQIESMCGNFPVCFVGAAEKLGRSAAANFGIKNAKGEYLAFLDDDDLIDPWHISSLMDTLRKSPNCLASHSDTRVTDVDGKTIGTYKNTFSATRLLVGNFIPIHSVLFSNKLVQMGCSFDESLESYEDWDFWLQTSRLTHFAQTCRVSASYRSYLGDSGMSQPADRKLQRQRRSLIWKKWWPQWRVENLEILCADFDKTQDELSHIVSHLNQTVAERDARLDLLHKNNILLDELIVILRQELISQNKQIELLNHNSTQLNAQIHHSDVEIDVSKTKIVELESKIVELKSGINERDDHYQSALKIRDNQINALNLNMQGIFASTSWKMSAPIRIGGYAVTRFMRVVKAERSSATAFLQIARRRPLLKQVKKIYHILQSEGINGIASRIRNINSNLNRNGANPSSSAELKSNSNQLLRENQYKKLSSIDISQYDFFFMDVFDTAIVRLFKIPTDLFEYMSYSFGMPDFGSRRIRQELEARIRNPERRDIKLAEIYSGMPQMDVKDEIATEFRFCAAHPEVFEFYCKLKAANKKIYFVSDMYLDKSTIERMLQVNGFDQYTDIFVSSEDDYIKGDGSRFVWMKKSLVIDTRRSIHIGDHVVSDFIQPKQNDFNAFHLMNAEDYYYHDDFLYSKIDFLEENRSLGLSFILGIFRYWKIGCASHAPDYWKQFGFLYGGALVTAFCDFIGAVVKRKNLSLNKIFFLARDGDIMRKVYSMLYNDFDATYLLASRRCMSFPSITSLSTMDDAEALKLYSTPIGVSSVEDIMTRFGYDDLFLLEKDLVKLESASLLASEHEICKCILNSKDEILKKTSAERSVLFDYLRSVGFLGEEDIVIVDVGWGGSIQNSLAKLLKTWGFNSKNIHGIYLGVRDGVEHREFKNGFIFENDKQQFSDFLNLIELITSSPQNGVVRIEKVNDHFRAVVGDANAEELKRQRIAVDIQEGILEFAKIIRDRKIGRLDFIEPCDFKNLFTALQEHPSAEDAEKLRGVKHAMTLGSHFGNSVLSRKY